MKVARSLVRFCPPCTRASRLWRASAVLLLALSLTLSQQEVRAQALPEPSPLPSPSPASSAASVSVPLPENTPLRAWYFAEGSTRGPYATTFILFNPGQQQAAVRFTLRLEQGGTRSQSITIPAMSRAAFDPRDLAQSADFATSITSDRPIIAERAYASTGDGLYGTLGYTANPARTNSRAWYFAEGNTTNQIEMFYVLFNFSEKETTVRGTYFIDGASAREQTLTVPAGARLAVRANDTVPDGFFSTRFVSDQDVLIERTLYLPGGSGFTTVGTGTGRP